MEQDKRLVVVHSVAALVAVHWAVVLGWVVH
jgi:hypothetical protein